MKIMMNFTTSSDDIDRYSSREELKKFYETAGLDGLELMRMEEDKKKLLSHDMIVGVHAQCINDWIDTDFDKLIPVFQKDFDYAEEAGAQYVVFHVTQVTGPESFFWKMTHSDEEVILAASNLINAMLDHKNYSFYFLMENLWWPGLNFLNPALTELLLQSVHYEKKGFMLDTGHFLHTNPNLRTQKEALAYLHAMLDKHEKLLPFIKGIHLHQSLSGPYIQNWLQQPHTLSSDPDIRMGQIFEHIFAVDKHLPFTDPDVAKLVERIHPAYLTLEYISRNKQEHLEYLRQGIAALGKEL